MRSMLKAYAMAVGWLSLLLLVPGCAPQAPDNLVPASGVLKWKSGEPLEGIPGIARFHPFDPENPQAEIADSAAEQSVVAKIEANGSFQVETSLLAGGKTYHFSGAEPGIYKVMLFLLAENGGMPRINPDYEHPVRTPLRVEVQQDDENHFVLEIDRSLNGWTP